MMSERRAASLSGPATAAAPPAASIASPSASSFAYVYAYVKSNERSIRSPAATAISSTTPGRPRALCAAAGPPVLPLGAARAIGRDGELDRLEPALLRPSERLDHDGRATARDARRLTQSGNHVVGEEERREAGHDVKRVVV